MDMPQHKITGLYRNDPNRHVHKKVDIGNAMVDILRKKDRVAKVSLIDSIPEEHQGVTPRTLGQITGSHTPARV